jgi:hypothetical protein
MGNGGGQEKLRPGEKVFGQLAAVKKQFNELDKMDSLKEKLIRDDMRDRAIMVQKQLTVEHITEEQVESFFDFMGLPLELDKRQLNLLFKHMTENQCKPDKAKIDAAIQALKVRRDEEDQWHFSKDLLIL